MAKIGLFFRHSKRDFTYRVGATYAAKQDLRCDEQYIRLSIQMGLAAGPSPCRMTLWGQASSEAVPGPHRSLALQAGALPTTQNAPEMDGEGPEKGSGACKQGAAR